MADQLATREDLAAVLQQDVDNASADRALEASTAVIQAAAGQRIVLAANTETAWGGTDRVLRLQQRPVRSVTSVTYAGSLLTQGTASGTWRMSADGLWRDLGWTECAWEPSPVAVVYESGYDTDEQGIQLGRGICLSLSRGLFVNPSGVVREQIDDYSVAYAEASVALAAKPDQIALLRRQYGRKAAMVRVM